MEVEEAAGRASAATAALVEVLMSTEPEAAPPRISEGQPSDDGEVPALGTAHAPLGAPAHANPLTPSRASSSARPQAEYKAQRGLARKYSLQLLLRVLKLLRALPSLVRVPFPPSAPTFNVCGDTHGQYYDTLHIFELAGEPGPANPYLFNGDFVDRGSFSLENVMVLLAWKLLFPGAVHLTRGNHETKNMNKMYGFEGEVRGIGGRTRRWRGAACVGP